MKQLNEQQKRAVLEGEGHILILAGAGSGKTRVLTERIVYLIREKNVSPQRILAFTFTNKAAGEMKERVQAALNAPGLHLWIGTFHATGLRILRREARHIGFNNNFAIYDEDDSMRLIKEIIKSRNWNLNEYPAYSIRNRISRWKNKLVTPAEALENAYNFMEEQIAEIYRIYTSRLKKCNAFDFDDLITRTVELFTARPKIRERYSRQFEHVLVDEFQDTNTIQMVMIDQLASESGNLFVVGDDDQAIYAWRGATVENILQFDEVYSGTRVIRLEENYRSTNLILEAANRLIANNRSRKGKTLWSRKGKGKPVQVYYAGDDGEEAAAVRESIISMLRNGYNRSEIAVLYRTHAQSRALEKAFNRGGLPYQIIGGVRFYERREIKDLLGYLKLINNPRDRVNFQRVISVPRRGIGKVTVDKLMELAGDGSPLHAIRDKEILAHFNSSQSKRLEQFSEMMAKLELSAGINDAYRVLTEVVDRTGYQEYLLKDEKTAQDRLENVEELMNETSRFVSGSEDGSLSAFLEEIALISDVDRLSEDESVALMTLHNSKGLEYRAVMITGLEEGLLPHYSSFESDPELEEERRLLYVGMTRAKELLFLFSAANRMRFGIWQSNIPSRFLSEIPDSCLNRVGAQRESSAAEETFSEPVIQRSDRKFRKGAAVSHPAYGDGVIRMVEGSGKNMKVVVAFHEHGSKKFLANYAPFTFR